jgi:hypothetical protein
VMFCIVPAVAVASFSAGTALAALSMLAAVCVCQMRRQDMCGRDKHGSTERVVRKPGEPPAAEPAAAFTG